MKQSEREEIKKQIVEYRKQGHYVSECAERFNVKESYVHSACRGIDYPWVVNTEAMSRAAKLQSRPLNETNAISMIEDRASGFEYAGGYTGSDGHVFLKCVKCGTVFKKDYKSVRQGKVNCPNCKHKRREAELEAEEALRQAKKEKTRLHKIEVAKEKAEALEARRHFCPICGKETTRRVYCSSECARKGQNQKHEAQRRVKIRSALVDTGITLQEVYRRDNGKCYICGRQCDWKDKEEIGGTIVCGNNYPSIDHVKPLAAGGLHSWGNVRLACRCCNTKKGANYSPLVEKFF